MNTADASRGAVFDCMNCLPLPVLVVDESGDTVFENSAYRAKFGPGSKQAADDLAVALKRGRESAIRGSMDGISQVIPLGIVAGAPLVAHYFPIAGAERGAARVGILLLEVQDRATVAPPRDDATALGGEPSRGVEKTLRSILDGVPQLVFSTRPDGYPDFHNRQWYEYTGAELTRGYGWLDVLHPDDQRRARERWERSVETGEDYEIEYRFRRRDGVYRWFLGRARPMRDETGRIVRWFGTCTDVDDQKRLDEQRAEVLAQAEATSRMKDEFLAVVSHELRTPLTAILGWARLQQTRSDLVPKAMAVIERNARAQAKLIEEILDTSRIVTGKVRLAARRADLSDVVQAAVDTIRPTAESKGVHLDIAPSSRPVPVVCDAERLQQVVLNLLVNAVKFTPTGGRVHVRVDAAEPARARVVVADTGPGIAPAFLNHVFDPFRQADGATTRQHGGLGLGLAIVKHLVELHGGTVTASSEGLGKGATFVVELPLGVDRVPALSDVLAPGEAAEMVGGRSGLDGIRVLVVDDEVDARELVTVLLREAGAETLEAGSVSSALDVMHRSTPDVLVSDIGMPIEDGYSLLRKLRQGGGDVPAIALTAFTRNEDVERSRQAGFARHLAKPVEPAELIAAIRQLATSGDPT
jgi:PAS domain S-box-containing protein